MTVLSIIFGILAIACGASCFFAPIETFLHLSYFVAILAAVYGVSGIIRSIGAKTFGVGFVFSILSVLFSIALLVFPRLMILTDVMFIYFAAGWLIMQGIVSFITAIQTKSATGSAIWVFQLIFGIIGVLLGAYTFFHPSAMAVSLGWLIGFWFIETGFTMIFFASKRQ